ncbi:MAG: NifB/NifX family molybdenum-iron cluster-binding protein [Desulfovibrionaceae bacterium]|nr:NifB/NifX family molybdenum-iron cluster-binding protein [Desulfovibrionaceae bacterium]
MSTFLLAVPSVNPGGLEAGMGMHFGRCDLYTLVDVEDNAVKAVRTLPGIPHEEGGCLAAVRYLAGHGVTTLLAGGMGMRPLAGFQRAGIEVLFAGARATVGEAVNACLQGELPPFSADFTCRGGHH